MSLSEDAGTPPRVGYPLDPEATSHELLNGAIEFLQYARGISELLADLVHESDVVDCRRMALSLEAIGALANMGMQCTALAHARMSWEKAGFANAVRTDVGRPDSE